MLTYETPSTQIGEADATSKASAAITEVLRIVLEPPAEGCQNIYGEGGTKKRRDMSVDHTADLSLAQRYMEVRKQLHELMQEDVSNDSGEGGGGGSGNMSSSNTVHTPGLVAGQQQVASAAASNGNKVRVRSGGNDNGSSGSGGSGPKVVMM